jgi:hypothetical protein
VQSRVFSGKNRERSENGPMKLQYLAYGSADCPLIRRYDFQTADAVRLKALADKLAGGSSTLIALDEQTGILPVDGCQLNLRVSRRNRGIIQVAEFGFACRLTNKGWSDVASLTEPFCGSVTDNAYQWLNEDGEISLLLSASGRR